MGGGGGFRHNSASCKGRFGAQSGVNQHICISLYSVYTYQISAFYLTTYNANSYLFIYISVQSQQWWGKVPFWWVLGNLAYLAHFFRGFAGRYIAENGEGIEMPDTCSWFLGESWATWHIWHIFFEVSQGGTSRSVGKALKCQIRFRDFLVCTGQLGIYLAHFFRGFAGRYAPLFIHLLTTTAPFPFRG